jgi:hypothetical protein
MNTRRIEFYSREGLIKAVESTDNPFEMELPAIRRRYEGVETIVVKLNGIDAATFFLTDTGADTMEVCGGCAHTIQNDVVTDNDGRLVLTGRTVMADRPCEMCGARAVRHEAKHV